MTGAPLFSTARSSSGTVAVERQSAARMLRFSRSVHDCGSSACAACSCRRCRRSEPDFIGKSTVSSPHTLCMENGESCTCVKMAASFASASGSCGQVRRSMASWRRPAKQIWPSPGSICGRTSVPGFSGSCVLQMRSGICACRTGATASSCRICMPTRESVCNSS